MRNNKDEITKLQGERLAISLGLVPGVYFTIDELTQIANAQAFDVISFRGKMVKTTIFSKSLAELLLIKIQRQNK